MEFTHYVILPERCQSIENGDMARQERDVVKLHRPLGQAAGWLHDPAWDFLPKPWPAAKVDLPVAGLLFDLPIGFYLARAGRPLNVAPSGSRRHRRWYLTLGARVSGRRRGLMPPHGRAWCPVGHHGQPGSTRWSRSLCHWLMAAAARHRTPAGAEDESHQ